MSYNKAYYESHKKKISRSGKKYYKIHKKKIQKRVAKYYKDHIEEYKKRDAKRHRVYSKKDVIYRRVRFRKSKGITSKSKCINGCKCPWQVLEKHHLTKTKSVIFCPTCHRKYHWKLLKR